MLFYCKNDRVEVAKTTATRRSPQGDICGQFAETSDIGKENAYMAFTRKTLSGYGLNEEQLEKVMTLYSTSLSDFVPKTEVQTQIKDAVEQAKKELPAPDISKNEEYLKVVGERDMLRALGGKEFEGVKPKFRESVYKMLNREDGAEPIEKQLEAIAEDYEEYFAETPQETKPPQFGAGVTGSMPKGDSKPTFESLWGFDKKGE